MSEGFCFLEKKVDICSGGGLFSAGPSMRKVSIALLGLFLFGIASAQSKYNAQVDSALALGLKCLLMKPADLTFRNDYTEVDDFRLKLMDSLMHTPGFTISSLLELKDIVYNFGGMTDIRLDLFLTHPIWEPALDLHEKYNEIIPRRKPHPWDVTELEGVPSEREYPDLFKANKILKKVTGKDTNYILRLFLYMQHVWNVRPPQDSLFMFLRHNAPILLLEDVNDQFKTPEKLDQNQKYEEELAKQISKFREKFDWIHWMWFVSAYLGEAAINFENEEQAHRSKWREENKQEVNDIIFHGKTKIGDILIGGTGSSYYYGSPALIIDLGGDDVYELEYDSLVCMQTILDLSGDDIYRAKSDFAIASGFFGGSILIDEEGNDTYIGKNFSLGSGLFGIGVLIDRKGDDKYFGDTYTQGAGGWGLGLLIDLEGTDTYNGALFSQGFGFVAGCGMLIDRSGSDNYFAGGKYKDILRYKDHYLSLSQGFAYGIRPYMSGGIGLLFDYSGNDIYNADIFGQGSSYWWGWGGLYDKEGNDYYSCFQYAQGCGTHMTLGTLVDAAGDDIYRVNGVGQGCGHDYSAGILLDKAGNDNYYANGLSQGAGNANGFGILIDQAGDDGYYAKEKSNTRGYGNPRREFGSIGLFLDLKGNDNYSGNGSEGSWWSIGSKWGIGLDLKEEDLAEYYSEPETISTTERHFKMPGLPAFHMADWEKAMKTATQPENESLKVLVDSLFIQATAINVEHLDRVEPAKQALREMKENSIPYLVKKLDSRDAREIQTLVDILGKIPEATLPVASVLGELQNEDNWKLRNACRVLGELKDTVAVPYLIDILNHPDYQVRGYALTAIGNAKDTSAFNWVAFALSDSVEVVRKSSVYALGELQDERGVDYLIYALDDPHYSVLMAAVEALGKLGEKAVGQLKWEYENSLLRDKRLLCISALGKTKTQAASNYLWQVYDRENWRGKGTTIEALGGSDNMENAIKLNLLKEKEKHPFITGKLALILNKFKR